MRALGVNVAEMDRKEATEDVRGAQIVPKVAQTAQGRAVRYASLMN